MFSLFFYKLSKTRATAPTTSPSHCKGRSRSRKPKKETPVVIIRPPTATPGYKITGDIWLFTRSKINTLERALLLPANKGNIQDEAKAFPQFSFFSPIAKIRQKIAAKKQPKNISIFLC